MSSWLPPPQPKADQVASSQLNEQVSHGVVCFKVLGEGLQCRLIAAQRGARGHLSPLADVAVLDLDALGQTVGQVDTAGKGVERVTEKGVVVDGIEYELDCLIFATGFEVSRATYTHQADLEIIGRDGVKLGEHWANGMRTYQGLMSHGFPNCYHMGFTQTGYTPNFTYMLENQSRHLAEMITDANERGYTSLEPTQKAEENYLTFYVSKPTLDLN